MAGIPSPQAPDGILPPAAVASGTAVTPDHLAAAYTYNKLLARREKDYPRLSAQEPPSAEQVAGGKVYELRVTSALAFADGVAMPPWANLWMQQLQGQLQQVQGQLQGQLQQVQGKLQEVQDQLQGQLQQVQDQVAEVQRGVDELRHRTSLPFLLSREANARAHEREHALAAVPRHDTGELPEGFPQTRGAFLDLRIPAIVTLLTFYRIPDPVGDRAAKLSALGKFIGCNP